MRRLRALLVCLGLASVRAFYLPGVAVREYQQDERIEIKVNKLSSTKTQLVRCLKHQLTASGSRASAVAQLNQRPSAHAAMNTAACLRSPDAATLPVGAACCLLRKGLASRWMALRSC